MGNFNDLLSGLIGSLIGGGVSYLAAWQQMRQQAEKARADESATISGFLGAIEAELTVLWERYSEEVRPLLSAVQRGEALNVNWPTSRDYFTVYAQNASLLGRIPDAGLRTDIVRAYTYATGMLDSLQHNSAMICELERMELDGTPISGPLAQKRAFLQNTVIEYAQALSRSNARLAQLIEDLLPRLRKRLT